MKHAHRSILALAALSTAVVLSGCSSEGEGEGSITRESALTQEDELRKEAYNLVDAEYQFCLGRGPETTGLAIWADQLQRGQVAPENLRSAICDSNEGRLANLYFVLLARDPDATGMAQWLADMDRGASLDAIAAMIRSSAEFATVTEAKKLSLQTVRQNRAVYAATKVLAVKALL